MTDLARTLLEHYTAGSGADLPQLLSELLTQRTQLDPATAMLLTRTLLPRSVEETEAAELPPERDAQRVRTERRLKRLQHEVEMLRRRNDGLAGALGACYLCWGDDAMCLECGGSGNPGSAPPDNALFEVYIRPVLRRLQPVRRQTPSIRTNQTNSVNQEEES